MSLWYNPARKEHYMLKKIAIAGALAVTVGTFTSLSVQHYHNYVTEKARKAQTTAQKQIDELAKVKKDAELQYHVLVDKYNFTVAECQKGVSAYAQLPQTIKAKVPAPDCTK